MADIILNYRGLTGKRGTVTVDDTGNFLSIITAILADEDPTVGVLTGNDYDIALERDTSITDVANGTDIIGDDLNIVAGDTIICIDDKKNLTSTNTKEVRQNRKLRIASVKREREGKLTYSFDATLVPNPYEGNAVNEDDDENTGALVPTRPWLGASVGIASSILDDAFVYLDAGSAESYGGTGTTWSDLSGNNFDATLVGAPPYNANPGSFTLAGGDHATLPTGFSDSFASGFGLFAIWNFGTASNYERIIDLGQGSADDNIIVGRKQTTDTFFYQLYNGATGGTFVEVDNAIQNSSFASYGVSINGTDGRLYVNGELEGTETGYTEVPTNVSRDSNFIGKSNWGSDGVATGAMGVVLIFRRALTADEMASLHNSFAARYGLTQV
jgi:hypothetical protein